MNSFCQENMLSVNLHQTTTTTLNWVLLLSTTYTSKRQLNRDRWGFTPAHSRSKKAPGPVLLAYWGLPKRNRAL